MQYLLRDAERGGCHVGDVPVEEGEGVGGVRGGGEEGDGEERHYGRHCSLSMPCLGGGGGGGGGREGDGDPSLAAASSESLLGSPSGGLAAGSE